jgi:hypothetical protein
MGGLTCSIAGMYPPLVAFPVRSNDFKVSELAQRLHGRSLAALRRLSLTSMKTSAMTTTVRTSILIPIFAKLFFMYLRRQPQSFRSLNTHHHLRFANRSLVHSVV